MSKYNIIDVWNHYYGEKEDVKDYAGRLMKKSACGNPNSNYRPNFFNYLFHWFSNTLIIGLNFLMSFFLNDIGSNRIGHWEVKEASI